MAAWLAREVAKTHGKGDVALQLGSRSRRSTRTSAAVEVGGGPRELGRDAAQEDDGDREEATA